MAPSQVYLMVAALCVVRANGFCVWRPQNLFVPSEGSRRRRHYYGQYGRDPPKSFKNFSEAADACLVGKTSSNCRQILCTEEECTAPAGHDHAGMLYSPSGNCYQPLPSSGYCNRRSWYVGHPCKLNRQDYCCEFDCEHCGPRSFCASTFGEDSGTCNPQYSGRSVCAKYFQACGESPNPGRALLPGMGFNTSAPAPAPPPPAPLSTVQLGGGVKTKSCAGHGLSPVDSLDVCELVAQAMGVSSVTQCDDPKECSKRPYGCIVQKSASCPSCGPTRGMMNRHGQDQWCGVGGNEYERFDCICIRPGNESMPGTAEGQHHQLVVDKQVADKQVAAAKAEAHQAEAVAAMAKRHAEEGWKMAAEVKKNLMEETAMYMRLEAELKQWKELAKRRQEVRERNASNAAEVLSLREEELRWMRHSWLPAILGLTGVVLVCCAICAFVMVCCFTFGYARVARDAREPKVSELQAACVQGDPTSEFSQM